MKSADIKFKYFGYIQVKFCAVFLFIASYDLPGNISLNKVYLNNRKII